MALKMEPPEYRLFSESDIAWYDSDPNSGRLPQDKNIVYFFYGQVSGREFHRLTGLQAICELTGLPPQKVKRYIGNTDDKDKKYLAALLKRYGHLKGFHEGDSQKRHLDIFVECTKKSVSEILTSQDIPEAFLYRGDTPDNLRSPRRNHISEPTITQHLWRMMRQLHQDTYLLRDILLDITDPYYE